MYVYIYIYIFRGGAAKKKNTDKRRKLGLLEAHVAKRIEHKVLCRICFQRLTAVNAAAAIPRHLHRLPPDPSPCQTRDASRSAAHTCCPSGLFPFTCAQLHTSAYVSVCSHTPAYVSIRQHTALTQSRQARRQLSIRQHTSAYASIRQHTSAYVSIHQHTSAYINIRQHTSAYRIDTVSQSQPPPLRKARSAPPGPRDTPPTSQGGGSLRRPY
jgi:hypothetical protein